MEFDWNNLPFELDSSLTHREIEESFEDPFALRLLPDSPRFSAQARFFNLGMSANGTGTKMTIKNQNKTGGLQRTEGRERKTEDRIQTSDIRRPSSGFSLIELIVVISIIALLAALIIPISGAVAKKRKISVAQSEL